MDNEHIILNSRPISIASYTNYKEAVFLISVLDEPDSYGRIIPEEAGEKTCRGEARICGLLYKLFDDDRL